MKILGVGSFGVIYSGLTEQAAIDFLITKRHGEKKAAFVRFEIGKIDLVWGEQGTSIKEGHGLVHILEKHPEIISELAKIIIECVVYKQGNDRLLIVKNVGEDKNQVAAVRLDWNGNEKTWLVSAFNEP